MLQRFVRMRGEFRGWTQRAKSWWFRHVGRRGSALLFFSFLDGYYGWNLLTLPPVAESTPTFKFIDEFAPIEIWAGIWGITSLTCLVFAFRRWDGIAFAIAIALFALWGFIYVAGDVTGHIYRGNVAASIWFAFALFVLLISGWPEESGGDKWTQQT